MNMGYNLVLCFFFFSFCGWICETVFCSLQERQFVNRGFLNGPLCPIYGFGGLLVVFGLEPVRDNIVLLFFVGMLATTALEYATSYLLEKLFHTSWWNYADLPLNLNGRVCLRFALVFGGLSVIAERLLAPPFRLLLEWLSVELKHWLAGGLLLAFTVDLALTVTSILQLNGRLAELRRVGAELLSRLEHYQGGSHTLAQHLEVFKMDKSEGAARLRESLSGFLERFETLRTAKLRLQHRRLFRAFPRMKSTKYADQMAQMRSSFDAWREKRLKKR